MSVNSQTTSSGGLHCSLREENGTEILGQKPAANSLPVVLASNQPAIPVEPGSRPTFVFASIDEAIGTNKSMISIVNTDTSPVFIRSVRLVNSQTGAITGVIAEFRLLRCTGHSGGALVTGERLDSADTIPAALTCRRGATLAGIGTTPIRRNKFSTDEWGVGAADVESMDHIMQTMFPWYSVADGTKPLTLRQNEGMTVQQVATATVGSFTVIVEVTT
jgi:hypothetical protein